MMAGFIYARVRGSTVSMLHDRLQCWRSFCLLGVILCLSVFLSACHDNGNITPGFYELVITTPDKRIIKLETELAATEEEQQKGLMHRESIPDDYGMLFIFTPAREVGFWMKNTLIPLDIIFIAPDGVIHKIHRNARPHDTRSIPSDGITRGVLEINGGLSDKLGLIEGSKVALPSPEITQSESQ